MKYCPKCGTKLPDDARFCGACGAPQPNMVEKAEEPVPQVAQAPAPQVAQAHASSQQTPAQRYQELMQNDERFSTIVKATKRVNLITLIGLLSFIVWVVCMFTPVATFTGAEMSSSGRAAAEAMGLSFPHDVSAVTILELSNVTSASKLTLIPGAIIGPMQIIPMIASLIMMALLIVMAFVSSPKGYMLRTYEAGKADELIKNAKSPMKFLIGVFVAFLPFLAALNTFLTCSDVKYEYKDSTRYFFGEVMSKPEGFIACVVTFAVVSAVMFAVSFVLRSIFLKKLNALERSRAAQ